ncbi:MAG: hypothetical protein ACERLM_11215, partial [Acidimicrobiales bacterium]
VFDATRQVSTRIGELSFDHDYPTNRTVQRLYDTMDFQRACQLNRGRAGDRGMRLSGTGAQRRR